MFYLSGLICLVLILFVIVGKSFLKGGAHSRGRSFKNIYFRGRSFEAGDPLRKYSNYSVI